MRVLAALSGGVDSAVAAARAVDAGHDVTAVHLALSSNPQTFRSGARGCCSLEDSRDARRVADVLGIPYYVWDLAEEFKAEVVDDFLAEYAAGRTPNPCLRCNERIKFAAVLERGLGLGFDAVCTGHYARLERGTDGVELHRAADPAKDQSYVLAVLTSQQLEHSMFPLGDSLKTDVRVEATERGLLVADKPDSHDICFIANGDTKGFLETHLGQRPGRVVDENGEVLGDHSGAFAFTVGQRRGLGLTVAAPNREPRYVLSVEPVSNTVTVGPRDALSVTQIEAGRPTWCGTSLLGVETLDVQYRAHGEAVPATVRCSRESVEATLDAPTRGVAPGQTLALYDGTRVRGSATITSASP
ncbi:MAG TPA: tRNA 2-thiouridine(34) synthase MnmA [Actinomycetes bacterium]|nr:tRNA 2-thiouridine(34) synthase MnmA [Actinomycetes bacterium]